MMNLVTNEKQELLYLDGDIINMCSVFTTAHYKRPIEYAKVFLILDFLTRIFTTTILNYL